MISPSRLWAWVLGATAAVSALALFMALSDFGPDDVRRETAFWVLFSTEEAAGAVLGLALLAAAVLVAPRVPERVFERIERAGREPAPLILTFTLCAAAASVLVYRAHPLSMDEYAPWFQARVFAEGRLTGEVPPALLARVVPNFIEWFLEASRDGQLISSYWPGLALLLAPFARLGVPWLLNPLLGGATIFALWLLARRLCPEDERGQVLLLAAASPVVFVDAISFYSMSAHLLFNVVYAWLLVGTPTARRAALAGLVGSFALSLHNPVPHALFALPYIAWVALRPRRRHLAALALGYLPLTLLLVVGWALVRATIVAQSPALHPAVPHGQTIFTHWLALAFDLPSPGDLWARLAGLLKLALWASPGLLPLACLGGLRALREAGATRDEERAPFVLLASAALVTATAYLFVPHDQGHGWGYRYFHSAWATLPLLALLPLRVTAEQQPEPAPWPLRRLSVELSLRGLRRTILVAALFSLALALPVRLWQVRTFIDRQLAQIPPAPGHQRQVVFVRDNEGFYPDDLVQDDPFLRGPRVIFYSKGKAADAALAQQWLGHARLFAHGKVADVWVAE